MEFARLSRQCTFAGLSLMLLAVVARTVVAQLSATLTNDWDSHISDADVYTHAVNVGDQNVTVNGVEFDPYNSLGSTLPDAQSGNTFALSGTEATIFDDLSPFPTNVSGQSQMLTPGFIWGGGGDTYSLELNNLTSGQPYRLSLYQVAWNDPEVPSRATTLTTSGLALGTYDVQTGGIEPDGTRNGTIVTFDYTPDSSSVTFHLNMAPGAESTAHLQAFSNHVIESAPPLPKLEPPTFVDVTEASGLSGYRATSGDLHGPGAVFTDLDNDGYPDLYLVRNNSAVPEYNQLYLNKSGPGDERVFELQTDALGALNPTNGGLTNYIGVTGAVAGDYDNDGDKDLYVTNMGGPNRLYQNQLSDSGSLSFVEVGLDAGVTGLTGSPHSLTAAWADPDRDGDLDLYVGSHDKWTTSFNGERDTFYRNNGDGTFTDVTLTTPGDPISGYLTPEGGVSAGNQTHSSTNAVIFADFNNDQWPDLLVTNKTNQSVDRDMLYINQGNDDSGDWQGFKTATYLPEMENSFGINWADSAMGVDVDDIDNDGDLDIIISDNPFHGPVGPNDIFINQLMETGVLSFEHRHVATGLSWGVNMEDFDNDGYVEVHVTNDTFDNDGKSALLKFIDPTDPLNSPIADVAGAAGIGNDLGNDRGNVAADFNRDGKLDLFVVNLNNDPRFAPTNTSSVLYENTTDNDNGYLSIRLIGNPNDKTLDGFATSLDAIGSRVVVQADINGDGDLESMMREVMSGSGNAASTNSLEVEFGLGTASNGDVSILWADGRITSLGQIASNQFLTIDQSNFLRLPGDFNGDGRVDLADYTVWRDNLGGSSDLSGNGDETGLSSGVVDADDYALWRTHYGASAPFLALPSQPVPELPSVCSAIAAVAIIWRRRR